MLGLSCNRALFPSLVLGVRVLELVLFVACTRLRLLGTFGLIDNAVLLLPSSTVPAVEVLLATVDARPIMTKAIKRAMRSNICVSPIARRRSSCPLVASSAARVHEGNRP